MRSAVIMLVLIFAVFFGSAHASAFSHQHDDAADVTQSAHHDTVLGDDHDPAPADSDDPGQLTHSHCAMAAIVSVSVINAPVNGIRVPAASRVVTAMSSLGIPPPLEPPSA